MTQPIADLRAAIITLFEFMPNASKDFRVGILAFRQGVVNRYPITPILPKYEDSGQSQKSVLDFLGSLTAKQSATEHSSVFREALAMLKNTHPIPNVKRKERIVFLGDVGTSELDGQPGYSASERATKNRLTSGFTKWSSKGNRGVAALYAESNYNANDPSAAESRQWFKELGSVSPNSSYNADSNALLRAILNASIE